MTDQKQTGVQGYEPITSGTIAPRSAQSVPGALRYLEAQRPRRESFHASLIQLERKVRLYVSARPYGSQQPSFR